MSSNLKWSPWVKQYVCRSLWRRMNSCYSHKDSYPQWTNLIMQLQQKRDSERKLFTSHTEETNNAETLIIAINSAVTQ